MQIFDSFAFEAIFQLGCGVEDVGDFVPFEELFSALAAVPISQEQVVKNRRYVKGQVKFHLCFLDPVPTFATFLRQIVVSLDFVTSCVKLCLLDYA